MNKISNTAQNKFSITCMKIWNGTPLNSNGNWYKNYQWLECSIECDAAFCFRIPCRMFNVGIS